MVDSFTTLPRWRNWQTRNVEVVVGATPCWFNSSPGHFILLLQCTCGSDIEARCLCFGLHAWFATFGGKISAMHPAQLPTDDLLADCNVRMLRRGGPGGQHRNKVETAVVIEHIASGIRAEANERRSQADNRRVALQRLRLLLAIQVRTPSACDSNGNLLLLPQSELWQSRAVKGRIQVSAEHDDFPAILAEVLDVLWSLQHELNAAAAHFGVSSSQLVNLIRTSPAALSAVNHARAEIGLHRLR